MIGCRDIRLLQHCPLESVPRRLHKAQGVAGRKPLKLRLVSSGGDLVFGGNVTEIVCGAIRDKCTPVWAMPLDLKPQLIDKLTGNPHKSHISN